MGTQPDWVQHAHARSIDGDAALRFQGVVTGASMIPKQRFQGVVTGVVSGASMIRRTLRRTQTRSEQDSEAVTC
jgi:hypothetical protein